MSNRAFQPCNDRGFTQSSAVVYPLPALSFSARHELIGGDFFDHIKLAVSPGVFENIFNQFHFSEACDARGDISPLIRKPEKIRFRLIETYKCLFGQWLHNQEVLTGQKRIAALSGPRESS